MAGIARLRGDKMTRGLALGFGPVVAACARAGLNARVIECRALPSGDGVASVARRFGFEVPCELSRGVAAIVASRAASRTRNRMAESGGAPHGRAVTYVTRGIRRKVICLLALRREKDTAVTTCATARQNRCMVDHPRVPGILVVALVACGCGRNMIRHFFRCAAILMTAIARTSGDCRVIENDRLPCGGRMAHIA